jgi:hypothetical protein
MVSACIRNEQSCLNVLDKSVVIFAKGTTVVPRGLCVGTNNDIAECHGCVAIPHHHSESIDATDAGEHGPGSKPMHDLDHV